MSGLYSLIVAEARDIDALMPWFADATAVSRWGGPAFRYPFTRESFHADCRWNDMASFALRNGTNDTVAFGQLYERDERIHFARIAVRPDSRGDGVGRLLMSELQQRGRVLFPLPEYSLFVMRDNRVAMSLYRKLGFRICEFPEDAPMRDECYYMTRPVERQPK